MPRDLHDVDLVTITFEGDIRLTALQILSVSRLLDHSNIGRYVVILNGKNNSKLEYFLKKNIEPFISSSLIAKIEYVQAAHLLPHNDPQGWRGQQLLKLVVAKYQTARYYLILDAKNHFIHRTSVADFFTDTAIKTLRREASRIHRTNIKKSFIAFDIKDRAEQLRDSAMPTITPYMMDAGLVRAMMSEIEARYAGKSFEDLFEDELSETTEFFLYWAYLVSTGQDNAYEHAAPMGATLFTKAPRNDANVKALLESAKSNRVATFGLHRRRISQLNEEQRQRVIELWRIELLAAYENPSWFMEIDSPMSEQ